MKKVELIRLRKLLQMEISRRNRINELLENNLIQEFLDLNNLYINKSDIDEKWLILSEMLKEFQISISNGILVCTGSYMKTYSFYQREKEYYMKEVPFDSNLVEYRVFKDIETNKEYRAYSDVFIQNLITDENSYYKKCNIAPQEFCRIKYDYGLISELSQKYILLKNDYAVKKDDIFEDVRKDFFTTAVDLGQTKAKQLILEKYNRII